VLQALSPATVTREARSTAPAPMESASARSVFLNLKGNLSKFVCSEQRGRHFLRSMQSRLFWLEREEPRRMSSVLLLRSDSGLPVVHPLPNPHPHADPGRGPRFYSHRQVYISTSKQRPVELVCFFSERKEFFSTGLTLNPAENEIGYVFDAGQTGRRLFWSLPPVFTGNKVHSYGGVITITQKYSGSNSRPDQDVILVGNGKTLYWSNYNNQVQPDKITVRKPPLVVELDLNGLFCRLTVYP